MTDLDELAAPHSVYPGGPNCQPNCPGPSSMYHDGYSDGYENAEASLASRLAALERVAEAAREQHADFHGRDCGCVLRAALDELEAAG